ncbi:Protein RUPTURED POLLEN GRAIN 1 [Musa troglodytarum]|uniref:Sugar transporter SWEET1 n=1 Tax=Musa troglodytarum TaxID=320322 RepID=A0A9E7FCS4_9LILI|nr:Protein RUPTURED POLLEN GRAIN 1 [Musa troglodytarum]
MAGLSLDHPWAFTFGILGNIISFMVYLAPLPTFYRVCRRKSTEGFHSVPYVVALFSATLWIFYAFVKTNAGLLITINAVGCVIETAYVLVYFTYAPKAAKVHHTRSLNHFMQATDRDSSDLKKSVFGLQMFTAKLVLLVNVGMFGLILLLTLLFAKGAKRVEVLGWICMSFSVSVFVAPLSIIVSRNPSANAVFRGLTILTRSVVAQRLVIRTKSVEFMPFTLSFFLTWSAVVWFGYGLLTKDLYVALPNVLGFIFGVLQMVLYVAYRNQEKTMVEQKLPEHIASKLGTAEKVLEIYAIGVEEKVPNRVQEEQDEDKQGMAAAPMEKTMKPAEV